jgi:hypothetical protein
VNTLTTEIVLLRGSSLLHAETLEEIATLDVDGQWRTPDGAIADAIGVPRAAAHAITTPGSETAQRREHDEAWLLDALKVLERIAATKPQLTVDDCWAAIDVPPRRPHLMSRLMVRAKALGLIEMTDAHERSLRPINGGRTVRVWRSLTYAPVVPGRAGMNTNRLEKP